MSYVHRIFLKTYTRNCFCVCVCVCVCVVLGTEFRASPVRQVFYQ
jgi:hypothetical protein